MDNRRLIVFIVLSFAILFFWQQWEEKRHPKPVATTQAAATSSSAGNAKVAAEAQNEGKWLQKGNRLLVKTDVIQAEIDTMGGDLRKLALLRHGSRAKPNQPLQLLDDGAQHVYVAQTGLLNPALPALPNHRTLFTAAANKFELDAGQKELQVRLEAAEVAGIKVAKIYTFQRGSYLVNVRYEVTSTADKPVQLSAYYRLLRDGSAAEGDGKMVNTFTGPAVYTDAEKFQKVSFEDIDKGKAKYASHGNNGWVAMVQHYFVSAWILSPQGQPAVCQTTSNCRFEVKGVGDGLYSAGAIVDLPVLAPGKTVQMSVPLYAGPEETRTLESVAPGFELVKDYGWTTVIAKPLFWLLDMLHSMVGNWGWAIVLLTMLVKLAFFPLANAQYRSAAKMKKLVPRMQRLKEQYGDDRVKYQQAVMELYKQEKANPLSGCLPILVQIPVFFALYSALLASVELRQAPWLGWIHDLSVPDPYYILPVVLAISNFVQTMLNPPATDPMQDKMMKIMPVAFSVLFFFFPAGLVLYWLVNNLLSIAQQWFITRQIERADERAKH
ncbi:membrane protein insertase YidC [Parachitinimonas caeni]|uniref:Membrane protein insertase YidC n=1 Tax=Parachitinimonas caeni TaxID=3031301 RepID=A0ABT7DS28_9NEIS|nr:membrane protein insertase YidC [Parachitinimonas caeni]MDK2122589.1 membrane protein insertase YidC [Parachitinimonas caeni]